MQTLQIGSIVNYKTSGTTNYMKNGIVTGFDTANNRVFVKWPQHGDSSIHISNLVFSH